METIRIEADRMFRAVTATGYKLLAYNLDLRTGEIISRTLSPDEVKAEAEGPSVKPLPKMGGDLTRKQEFVAPSNAGASAGLFGPPSTPAAKPKLFGDEGSAKPAAFGGNFWKRDSAAKPALFAEGFKKENATKKLAEIFGAPTAPTDQPQKLSRASRPSARPPAAAPSTADDPYYPRIPAADESALREWMNNFGMQCGDPQIRDQLLAALAGQKPEAGFERVLRQHPRMAQQWEKFLRKMALGGAEAWLSSLGVSWTWDAPAH